MKSLGWTLICVIGILIRKEGHQGGVPTEDKHCEDTEGRQSSAGLGERLWRNQALQLLHLGLPASRTVRKIISVVYLVCGTFYGSASKPIIG